MSIIIFALAIQSHFGTQLLFACTNHIQMVVIQDIKNSLFQAKGDQLRTQCGEEGKHCIMYKGIGMALKFESNGENVIFT